METTAITGAGQASPAPGRNAAIGSDFETFLRMLTVQLQNQDPTNPMEPGDFAVQLATFSGVEQQIRTNQMLESLSDRLGVMGMAQLSGWIGMEARADVAARFDGAPLTLSPEPASLADSAVLVVRDPGGAEIARSAIPARAEPMEWAGVDDTGAPLPQGLYTFELESYAEGQLLGISPVEVYSRVREARAGVGGEVMLVMEGGVSVPASSVTALRQPG